ncbi:hypothetical protein [Marinoscillum luteum]|uniref:Uncharacterized protein n=1 Tax=Marinoscillum luteum TaxID=861051 RepID=A0ABW7N7K4_9BACT
MKNFLVCYDLFGNKNYDKLVRRIEQYPVAQKVMNTTFLIKAEEDEQASNVLENLKQTVEDDDRILVIQVKNDAAQANSLTSDSGLNALVK